LRCLALAFVLWAGAATAAPLPVPYEAQPRGPFCAAATLSMVARAHGLETTALSLAREVEVHRDGIAWMDLAMLLEQRGLEVRVVQMDAPTLRETLAAGLPVVVSLVEGGLKHAVVVVGSRADGFDVLDPAEPARGPLSAAALGAVWARGQAVVVRRPSHAAPRLPWVDWRRQDARYRADEWLLRAKRNGLDQPGTRVLVERGLALEPDHVGLNAILRELPARPAPP
jgi:hypothetical protein